MPISNRNRRSISVIEAVVAVGLLIAIIAFALMAIERTRGSVAGNRTKDNLRRIGVGMSNYERTHKVLPK